MTKYVFVQISLWPVQGITVISQILPIFLLAWGRWRDGGFAGYLRFFMVFARDHWSCPSLFFRVSCSSATSHIWSEVWKGYFRKKKKTHKHFLKPYSSSPGRHGQPNACVCTGQVFSLFTALICFAFLTLWRRSKWTVLTPGMQNFKISLTSLFQHLEIFINYPSVLLLSARRLLWVLTASGADRSSKITS